MMENIINRFFVNRLDLYFAIEMISKINRPIKAINSLMKRKKDLRTQQK